MASEATEAGHSPTEPGRRQFLRRAAAVGAGVFVVPTVITIDAASAQEITSPPPEPPTPPTEVGGSVISRTPTTPAPSPQVAGNQVTRSTLPRTGAELDDLFVAGLAATAGGAALLLWSADSET